MSSAVPDGGPQAPAAAIYEIVLHDTAVPKRRLFGWFSRGRATLGGAIVSVRRIDTGDEIFRHVEDLGDDEDHMVDDLRSGLASMTASEFAAVWA